MEWTQIFEEYFTGSKRKWMNANILNYFNDFIFKIYQEEVGV